MKEILCNLHIHSTYSDGSGTYSSIANAALKANTDVIILTDHNVWVKGYEGYVQHGAQKVLVLTGEEVHNQDREPQKNHLLVFGAESEVATYASDAQQLINEVTRHGGLAFLAHPDEMNLPIVHEDDISWVDWQVKGFTGFELWNQLSELKAVSRTLPQLLSNVFFPEKMSVGPNPATLTRWDRYLAAGEHLTVVGGVDAHALHFNLGPIKKIIFPYEFHFSSIVNHLLIEEDLNGNLDHDKKMIYSALRSGSSFIAYDLPHPSRGFSFTISNDEKIAGLGETLLLSRGATVQVSLPVAAELALVKDGQTIYQSTALDHLAYPITETGAYRVEAHLEFQGQRRGWIFSNPIYVAKG
jgi:hypothetical protein